MSTLTGIGEEVGGTGGPPGDDLFLCMLLTQDWHSRVTSSSNLTVAAGGTAASDQTGLQETTTMCKSKTCIGAAGVAFRGFALTGTTSAWMPMGDIKTICTGTLATLVQTNNIGSHTTPGHNTAFSLMTGGGGKDALIMVVEGSTFIHATMVATKDSSTDMPRPQPPPRQVPPRLQHWFLCM